jgi:phenylpropionate dioxygenase-like ring-hydroxylating dioxygenase large terminal subunit
MANGVDLVWPNEGLTRVPYQLYTREDVYAQERERVFMGRTWNFLCLEAELANPGDWRRTSVGDVPVVVARDLDGSLTAFENRCAHRGALICHRASGNGARLACVYHGWTYDLRGNLASVTFRRGVGGKGGMPAEFRLEDHARRALRIETLSGLVFGSFAADAPPLEDYLGPAIAARLRRVLPKPVKVLGYNSQILRNNWKLYAGNVKDPYHASLLHLFFTTFRLNRLSAKGGIVIDESGAHHVSYSMAATDRPSEEYDSAQLRADQQGFRLADPSIIEAEDEFGDGITLQILSVFPGFVAQQIRNSLCVRQVVPRGLEETELLWTYYGFADDDDAMATRRLKQANLVGPGGYVSLEDGAVGDFVQRGIVGAGRDSEVVEMGGHGFASQDTRVTEAPLRGFWKVYREHMGL